MRFTIPWCLLVAIQKQGKSLVEAYNSLKQTSVRGAGDYLRRLGPLTRGVIRGVMPAAGATAAAERCSLLLRAMKSRNNPQKPLHLGDSSQILPRHLVSVLCLLLWG